MTNKIPCKDCVLLAICRSKTIDKCGEILKYTSIQTAERISIICWLAEGCKLVDKYITYTCELSDHSYTTNISHELCIEVLHFLLGE